MVKTVVRSLRSTLTALPSDNGDANAISFPGFSRTLLYGEKETTLGTRLSPIKTSLNNCRRVFQVSGLQHRDFENGEGSGVKFPHVECVEQKMSLVNFQI